MAVDQLRFAYNPSYFEGVIVEISDGAVAIDIKGRLGYFKMPLRMLICDTELKLGQEVGFVMSYPEVLGPEVNENYLAKLKSRTDTNKEGDA